jgi:phosphoglycerol transferase MdoB-like AlkP superfamily enzyme
VPYSLRKERSLKEQDGDYLQFLVYTNQRMSAFISGLKKNTGNNAVILLMSDHGFRFQDQVKPLSFLNFNAIYLPGKEYAGWYDGMTNVNQFRVLFNTLFHQQLPMLKDSIAK